MLQRSRVMLAFAGCLSISFLVCAPVCSAQTRAGSSTQQKLAALKQARDSGILTEDEYQQKVAALTGGKATAATQHAVGSAGSAGDAHTWKLKREEQSAPLTDYRTGQTRTFKMVSMLVPEGWSMQPQPSPSFGKIDCNDNSSRFVLSAKNGDGSIGVLVLPAAATFWSTNQSLIQQKRQFNQQWKVSICDVKAPEPLAANLRENVPKIMPGTQVVGDVQPIPELSAQLPQIVTGANQQMSSQGAHMSAEAGRIRITYSANGRQYEAWVVAMKTERTSPAPGGGQNTITDYPLLAIEFAPPGQLDRNDKLLSTVLASIQVDPEWTQQGEGYVAAVFSKINGAQQEVARIHANMAQDNARAAQQQQQIRNGVQQYRSQVMSNVAANRSAALDHSSQQFALYMGDQAIYKDPSTGQRVQMSSGYDHVWASTTGNNSEYILTDSASYNPNGNAGSAGWTQMQMEH